MPELPEVETIVRYLRPKIRGKRILGMEALGRRVFRAHKNPGRIKSSIINKKVSDVYRSGKHVVFELSDGNRLSLHLMMTGRLFLNPKSRSTHDRLFVRLSGGNTLVFNDIRQFGLCRFIAPGENLSVNDAISIDFKKFKGLIGSRRGAIKTLLLNQKIVSGIGNIYSDEILWYAGISPTRRTDSLKPEKIKNLYSAMKKVLNKAIKAGGTTSRDYRRPDGSEGGYYKIRKAYQRTGERCSRDSAIIRRVIIGQRSAHYCPRHQR